MFNKFVSPKLLATGVIRTTTAHKMGEILFNQSMKEADSSLRSQDAVKRTSKDEFNNNQVRYSYNRTLYQGDHMAKSGQLSGIIGDKNSPNYEKKKDKFLHELRSETKEIAREAMTDLETKKSLAPRDKHVHKNGLSLEALEEKRKERIARGEPAPSISESAVKTNPQINEAYGLHQRIIHNDEKGKEHADPQHPVYEHQRPIPPLNSLHGTEAPKIAAKIEGPKPPDMLNKEHIDESNNKSAGL
ncbi:MAG: hypothetical protein CK424_05805 [Legionella sp.]|nr:MAG: hypothetical protein CK424_05805 [Legionella sp.]